MIFLYNYFSKPLAGTESWYVINKCVLQMHYPDICHGGILQPNKLRQ